MPIKHSLQTAIHKPYAAVYADATERLAATGFVRAEGGGTVAFDSTDLYKIVLQLDGATEWVLTAITPTWVQVSGAGSLANDSITNALLSNMAQATIKGRASGAGTGDPTDLTGTQATAILDNVVGDSGSGGTKGLVPAPGAGDAAAGKFLSAGGTFAVPAGTGAETGANSDITSMDGLTGPLKGPTQIQDSNSNEVVIFGSTASAVNEVTITNKATGTGPTIAASGGDTDVNLNLVSKGAGQVQQNGVEVGYMGIPQNSQSAAYTTLLSDRGKHILHPSTDANARTFTIDSNANVPYPIGTAITFINMTSQVVTIAITSDTMNLAGTGTAGSRSLAQYGVATAIKIGTTLWIISGTGLT